MVRSARLWCRQSPKDREFEAGLRNPTTGNSLCQPSSELVPFSKVKEAIRKDKAAKGESWAPSFISCAQDTMGLHPIAPRAIGLWETFTF